MSTSTLSVVISNYNHGHYLPETLQSILGQSRPPDELILIDDGSTDNSVAVIERAARTAPAIRLIRNDRNRGPMYSHNRGLREACGKYVCCFSADELMLPGLLEKSMGILALHPQAPLCCSNVIIREEPTGAITSYTNSWGPSPCYFPPKQVPDLLRIGWITGSTTVVQRKMLLDIGGLLPQLRWHCDWFAFHTLAFRHGLCYVPDPLAMMRRYKTSYSFKGRSRTGTQTRVLHNVLKLLKSPTFRDVAPSFRKSMLLSHLGFPMLFALNMSPTYWSANLKTMLAILHEEISKLPHPAIQRIAHWFERGMRASHMLQTSPTGRH